MSSRSVTYDFVSLKTKSTHKCESTLEFDFLYLLEFDPLVRTFEMQPISIPFINENSRKVKYTPDVKAIYTEKGASQKDCKFSLVEIKYLRELEANKEEFALKFKVAKTYCEAESGRFEIKHEQDIQTQRLKSCKLLYRYQDTDKVPKMNFDFLKLAKDLKIFTANDWVDKIQGSDVVKGQALYNLWHLIATGHLEVDLDTPITMMSEIRAIKN